MGGLARRASVLRPLLAAHPAHIGVDAGGWAERVPNATFPVLRSQFVLEGLHEIGLEIANLSARDLRLGPDDLQALADSAQVQFVSANLHVDGAGWLRPYVVTTRRIGRRDVRIGVTGVTSQVADLAAWPDSLRPVITDPVASATEMLALLEPQTDVQILLAYLPAMELDKHAQTLAGYELLISGAGDIRESPARGGLPVVLSPGTRCKFAGWAALRPTDGLSFVLADGDVVQLDDKIPDDPALARRVASYKLRLGEKPAAAPAAAAGSDTTTAAAGH